MLGVFGGRVRCPWCGHGSDCAGWSEQPEGVPFEVECDECGRMFGVSYELRPRFDVELPSEMHICHADWSSEFMCPYWGIDDYCMFEGYAPEERDCEVNRGCPLGYGRED